MFLAQQAGRLKGAVKSGWRPVNVLFYYWAIAGRLGWCTPFSRLVVAMGIGR